MLKQEDSFPLREGLDLIIPVGITHMFGKEPQIVYYKEAYDTAKWLDGIPEDRLFSPDVIAETEERISRLFAEFGYAVDEEERGAVSCLCRIDSRDRLNKELILGSTEVIMPDCGYDNITECDLYKHNLLCFGTVIDGKIVSAAAENPLFGEANGGQVIDIGVETDFAYRNCGYGASNVAALAYYLLDPGKTVSYIVKSDNAPSLKLAHKVGFEDRGMEYQCVLIKS